jgi:hypothetical protein
MRGLYGSGFDTLADQTEVTLSGGVDNLSPEKARDIFETIDVQSAVSVFAPPPLSHPPSDSVTQSPRAISRAWDYPSIVTALDDVFVNGAQRFVDGAVLISRMGRQRDAHTYVTVILT